MDDTGWLGPEASSIFTELLERQGGVVLAFRRGDGSWDSSEVFRSDVVTSLRNFGLLTSAHAFLDGDDYSFAMRASAEFLWQAVLASELDTPDLAEVFRGLCQAYGGTGDRTYLRMIEKAADVLLPDEGVPDLGTAAVEATLHIVLSYPDMPRGYGGRVKAMLGRSVDAIIDSADKDRNQEESIMLAVLMDQVGAVLGRSRLRTMAREVVDSTFGTRADERWMSDVLVARYVYNGGLQEGDDGARLRRYLWRKVIYTVKSEETANLRLVCDLARRHWDEVLSPKGSSELTPKLDSIIRDKVLDRMNPDGGWGDDYVYRSTATAGIALFNIFAATGNEAFRDAAHDAGEYIRNNIWDMSDGIFYSMDRISELFFLLNGDVPDDSFALLLENYHERMLRALERLDRNDRERSLWYSAEICILTYYLERMTGDDLLTTHLGEVSGNIVHLLESTIYDSAFYPWLQAAILAQETLTGEDGTYFGLFEPYLARMTIDRDTTINEEIAYQRYLYTYDPVMSPELLRAAARRASGFIRKDIILNISNLIEVAKIYRLLEAGNGGDDQEGPARADRAQ